jgi:hypothetical protein
MHKESKMDFSQLSNEQLIGLIREALAEAVRRGCTAEAKEVYQTAKEQAEEQAEVARVAAALEAERRRAAEIQKATKLAAAEAERKAEAAKIAAAAEAERKVWAKKKGIVLKLLELVEEKPEGDWIQGLEIHVWQGADGEQRVYLQWGFDQKAVTYFATGNRYNAPGTLTSRKDLVPYKEALKKFCLALTRWNTLKIDASKALDWEGEAVSFEVEGA